MPVTGELLHRIDKGGTLDELANELDMRKSILVAIIEFLFRAGYLCEVCSGKECARCRMSKMCCVPVPGGGKSWVKMYVLTDKGRESITGSNGKPR
ncbi:hypothetical protein C5S53_15645 [Methanophagales archaeon]|nr:hypothetical protein C5S53_15645 [Methanophagales archaeon]